MLFNNYILTKGLPFCILNPKTILHYPPSWVNSTRFVMDTTIGKVRRENIIKRDGKCITFTRDGKTVDYYDLDDKIDVSSDIRILLWKD